MAGFRCAVVFAVIQQAAQAASQAPNGPFYGQPPWLVVLVGAVVAALVLWIFAKLMKWAIWVLILVVLIGGVATAIKMYLGN